MDLLHFFKITQNAVNRSIYSLTWPPCSQAEAIVSATLPQTEVPPGSSLTWPGHIGWGHLQNTPTVGYKSHQEEQIGSEQQQKSHRNPLANSKGGFPVLFLGHFDPSPPLRCSIPIPDSGARVVGCCSDKAEVYTSVSAHGSGYWTLSRGHGLDLSRKQWSPRSCQYDGHVAWERSMLDENSHWNSGTVTHVI